MKLLKVYTLVCLLINLSACAIQKHPAPIEYGRSGAKTVKESESDYKIQSVNEELEIRPVIIDSELDRELGELQNHKDTHNHGDIKDNASNNYNIIEHEVKNGETIEDLSLKYNQKVEDIAKINDIKQPYHIEEFDILKIRIAKDTNQNSQQIVSSFGKEKSGQIYVNKPNSGFINPVNGHIIHKFGSKTPNGTNKGISIAATSGEEVVASASGKVIYADYDATFGNLIIIKLNNKNIVTSYAHLGNIILDKGASVSQGEVIGYVGKTGKINVPQLHFAIREGKAAKDPESFVSYE